jgi:FkbM family methyltransferase
MSAMPIRWQLAAGLRRLPEFRGRDRLSFLLTHGIPLPSEEMEFVVGPGLRFRGRPDEDGSFVELYLLRHEAPSLAPILDAALQPGGVFFDVGANVGLYTAWAASRVGSAGEVHAFEPVPRTRGYLETTVELNRLAQVRIVPLAVGAEPGSVDLHLVPGASGLSTTVSTSGPRGSTTIRVSRTTLDAYVAQSRARPPDLVKIDVEGAEFEVIQGARALLESSHPPAVVFESLEGHLRSSGTAARGIAEWLRGVGYRCFALTRTGLGEWSREGVASSSNTLALKSGLHDAIHERLSRVRFRRNQTT